MRDITQKTLTLIVLVTFSTFPVHAGVSKDMSNFFNKFGAATNHTKGSSYQDQSGGYYNGGSFFMRSPSKNLRPVTVTPPGFRMGCGGIDLWSGGFGFINTDQLKGAMKNIIGGMGSYAFMLAVETYAPQVHNIMQQLNKLAADFNNMNINSCEAAAGMVGSLWPKSDLGSQSACRMLASHEGMSSDWAKARHACGQNQQTGLSRAKDHQLVGEFNLSWKVLSKISFDLTGDSTNLNPLGDSGTLTNRDQDQLKELFMTFSGTIIKKSDGKKRILAAHGDRENFLKALMSGGEITYYRCDTTDKCLNPTPARMNLDPNSALHRKVTTILESMSDKIQNDQGDMTPTPAETSLINATSLPLYKFINVTTAYQKGHAPISLAEYGEIIAFDVVVTYVNDVLMAFRESATNLLDLQFSDEDIAPFLKGLRETQQSLMGLRQNAFKKMDQMLGFIQKTQMIETQLHHMMGSLPEL